MRRRFCIGCQQAQRSAEGIRLQRYNPKDGQLIQIRKKSIFSKVFGKAWLNLFNLKIILIICILHFNSADQTYNVFFCRPFGLGQGRRARNGLCGGLRQHPKSCVWDYYQDPIRHQVDGWEHHPRHCHHQRRHRRLYRYGSHQNHRRQAHPGVQDSIHGQEAQPKVLFAVNILPAVCCEYFFVQKAKVFIGSLTPSPVSTNAERLHIHDP